MRAQFIYEKFDFERSKNPRKSLDIGVIRQNRDRVKRLGNFREAFPEITGAHSAEDHLIAPGSHPKWQSISFNVRNDEKKGNVEESARKYLKWFQDYTDFDIIEIENSFRRGFHPWGKKENPEITEDHFTIRMRNKEDMTK